MVVSDSEHLFFLFCVENCWYMTDIVSSSFTQLHCLSLSWPNSKCQNCIGIVYIVCVVKWCYCSLDTQTHICIMKEKLSKEIHNDSRGTSAPTNTSLLSSVSMWEKTTHQDYSLSRGSTLIMCIRELSRTFLFVRFDATAVCVFMWNYRYFRAVSQEGFCVWDVLWYFCCILVPVCEKEWGRLLLH